MSSPTPPPPPPSYPSSSHSHLQGGGGAPSLPRKAGPPPSSTKRKRLRKRKSVGLRKKLRPHIDSMEEFNPDARDAQSAEMERIRRLKLQQSIVTTGEEGGAGEGGVVSEAEKQDFHIKDESGDGEKEEGLVRVREGVSSSSPEVMKVETINLSQKVHVPSATPINAIVIDSGSSDSEQDVKYKNQASLPPQHYGPGGQSYAPADTRHGAGGLTQGPGGQIHGARGPSHIPGGAIHGKMQLHRKYDVLGGGSVGGKVVINPGHPPNEMDVVMAPQIARQAKAHQVRANLKSVTLYSGAPQ